ncbi:MAG: HAMP domain-containing sensor histidine kinase, partial [Acidobacteriota bacterium]
MKVVLPVLGLVALLLLLAGLQVHWLERMRNADQERTRADLESRLGRVADDFNRQLARLFLDMQPLRRRDLPAAAEDFPAVLAESLAAWRDKAEYPELVSGAYALNAEGEAWRLDAVPVAVDRGTIHAPLREAFASLQDFRARERQGRRDRAEPRGRPDHPALSLLLPDIPAVLIPLAIPARSPGPTEENRRQRFRNRRGTFWVIAAQLDSEVLLDELLPALVESAFGPQSDYRLQLLNRRDSSVLRRLGGDGGEAGRPLTVDASVDLFGPISLDRRGRGRPMNPRSFSEGRGLDVGHWRLQASHVAGSLDAAIAGAHRRNLALSLGILTILAAALFLLSRGAARAQDLARQQLDFVAGITHELMTPLAALRSAGQNLADGVVRDGDQIRRYGRMIDREGHRLSDLVGQVLAFSKMQSGPPQFHLRALDPVACVERVLDDMRPTLEAARIEPEVRVDSGDLGDALADSQALRRAIANLISNAVKYGQEPTSPWLGVAVGRDGGEIYFAVEDRGPGIPSHDLPHLFEPFVRGAGLAA